MTRSDIAFDRIAELSGSATGRMLAWHEAECRRRGIDCSDMDVLQMEDAIVADGGSIPEAF